MKAIGLGLVGAVLFCGVPQAPAQDNLPSAAREVLKQHEQELGEISKKTETAIEKRRDKAAEELKKLQDQFCKEAKLDEAAAIRDLIRNLQVDLEALPGNDLPPAAGEVYKQYQDEMIEIRKKAEANAQKYRDRATADLKKILDTYCKEAKLDEALAVRDVLRLIREGISNALADPGYINNKATDIGKVYYYDVTGVNADEQIYGTDVYTTGSHLGMAAVHCGILKPGQRGVVKVTILPGQDNYTASTRFGITSYAYGQWGVSFKVERVYGFAGKVPAEAPPPVDNPKAQDKRLKTKVKPLPGGVWSGRAAVRRKEIEEM